MEQVKLPFRADIVGSFLRPERVKKAMEMGQLGRAELKHCARRVLELILKID